MCYHESMRSGVVIKGAIVIKLIRDSKVMQLLQTNQF